MKDFRQLDPHSRALHRSPDSPAWSPRSSSRTVAAGPHVTGTGRSHRPRRSARRSFPRCFPQSSRTSTVDFMSTSTAPARRAEDVPASIPTVPVASCVAIDEHATPPMSASATSAAVHTLTGFRIRMDSRGSSSSSSGRLFDAPTNARVVPVDRAPSRTGIAPLPFDEVSPLVDRVNASWTVARGELTPGFRHAGPRSRIIAAMA